MFSLCSAMKWAHLPEPGGLYAQDPLLLDGFRAIFSAQAEHQIREEKARAAKMRSARPKGR